MLKNLKIYMEKKSSKNRKKILVMGLPEQEKLILVKFYVINLMLNGLTQI